MKKRDIIVIGASAGGLEALMTIVGDLPAGLPAAVLAVLHTTTQGPSMLPRILNRSGTLKAVHAADGDPLEHGVLYLAPPDHHLLVQNGCVHLSRGPKENRVRPAIDPLFRTAAASLGPRVIGVVLTGFLDDGTAGLSAVKECGGLAVVQDPADALYPSMPTSAARHVAVDHLVPLAGIGPLLARLAGQEAPEGTTAPLSRRVAIESRFVEMKPMEIEEMDLIGDHSGVSCPECHGPLWKIRDGSMLRYRCHVGHAFTAETMVAGQVESQEVYLWQAMRLMKERVQVLRELLIRTRADGFEEEAVAYEARIVQLEQSLSLLQQMIENEHTQA